MFSRLVAGGFARLEGPKETVREFADLCRQPREFFHARREDVTAPFADERIRFQFRMLAKRDRHAIDISGRSMPVAFRNVGGHRDRFPQRQAETLGRWKIVRDW